MAKRKPRFGEFVCHCRAYKFPHRFGGGKCTGIVIAEQTWEKCWGGGVCATCNALNERERYCEVVEGQEDISECEAYQEFIEYHEIKVYIDSNN